MTRLMFASLLLAAATVSAGPILAPGDEDAKQTRRSLYEMGLEYMQAGELDRAEHALRDHLRAEPGKIEARMWLTEVLFKKNDINGAGAQIEQAIALNPEHAPAHHAMGRFHYLKQDFDASELSLRKAVELDPSLFAARIDLADHYLLVRNDPDRAVSAYQDAIEVSPVHAGAYYGLGVAHNRAGNHDAAAQAWHTAADLSPRNPLPMFALGNMLMTQRKLDEAIQAFDAALDAEPNHLDSLVARGEVYAMRGESNAALEEFRAALAINPKYLPAHLKTAFVHQQQRDNARAIDAYEKVLEIDEQQPLAHNNLAWLLLNDRATHSKALEHARRATELQPRIGAYWDTLGWVQHRLGDHAAALQSLSKATESSRDAGIYEHLASVQKALGNGAAAAQAERTARELRQR